MISHHPTTIGHLHSTLQTLHPQSDTITMKWLLALTPLVAAAPALQTVQGDAPDPGQVCCL